MVPRACQTRWSKKAISSNQSVYRLGLAVRDIQNAVSSGGTQTLATASTSTVSSFHSFIIPGRISGRCWHSVISGFSRFVNMVCLCVCFLFVLGKCADSGFWLLRKLLRMEHYRSDWRGFRNLLFTPAHPGLMGAESRFKAEAAVRGFQAEFGKIGSGAGRVSTVMVEKRVVRWWRSTRMRLANRS